MLAVVVQVGGCGRTVAPSAAVVVYSLEPGKLARLLTLSTGYLSARLTCPLALGRALSLTVDGGARGCDRTRWCNLSPSKRQHSRREEKPKTGEAVKNCRNGTLSRAEAFPTADCPNIYIAYAHPFPR